MAPVPRAPFAAGGGAAAAATILFAQRALAGVRGEEAEAASALRGFMAFPALYLTLERLGATSPALLTRAASRARSLNDIPKDDDRRAAIGQFEAVLGILERMASHRGTATGPVSAVVDSLVALDTGLDGYGAGIAAWLRAELLPVLTSSPGGQRDPIEAGLLAAMAGPPRPSAQPDVREAALQRLRSVRAAQGGLSVDAAVALAEQSGSAPPGAASEPVARGAQVLADTLTAVLSAAYLADPSGSPRAAAWR